MQALSCHRIINEAKERGDYVIALAGNPNTGKSTLFNLLTGLEAVTANFPGKTVDINVGSMKYKAKRITFVDLPGIYSLDPVSEDQWVARRSLLEDRPDVVVIVVDASNLVRNLYLVLQCLDLEIPAVVALNMVDYATKVGLSVDDRKLSELLGVPVVRTVATTGKGVKDLVEASVRVASRRLKKEGALVDYSDEVAAAVTELERLVTKSRISTPFSSSPRFAAMMLLEGDQEFRDILAKNEGGEDVIRAADGILRRLNPKARGSAFSIIASERYRLAGEIATTVEAKTFRPTLLSERLRHLTVSPATGLPILALVFAGLFSFIFLAGGALSKAIASSWGAFVSPILDAAVETIWGGVIGRVMLWGLDAGVLAWLTIGVPYVLTFYVALSLLEDSGYLNSIAFLMDGLMHRVGLHGRAMIPMLAGAGCNVPAIMGTRVLSTRRERLIASTLIVLVPCSARLAVIVGAVANTIGWLYAFLILAFEGSIIILVGYGLHKVLPGESTGLVMEMFPFRVPSARSTLKKTWFRFRDFVTIAFPMVTLGSLAMGALYETGALWVVNSALAPMVTGILGLPAIAGLALVLGVLRKELTLELLLALAIVQFGARGASLQGFMTPVQLFVFALVVTIYVPCIATISVLGKELGWKSALLISSFTVGVAILVGGLANLATALMEVR